MRDLVTFADVAHPSVSFSRDSSADALVLQLIDSSWFQRLRDISQTANTRLVYMFSEHSRFGHCIGVAYLAKILLDTLSDRFHDEVEEWRPAVQAAALLHDIGHLAPGSHTAYTTWFPDAHDVHEQLGCRILREDEELKGILSNAGPELPEKVQQIICEDSSIPPWCWQVLSGGGWNADRGNWCVVDSVMAGVNYGRYNVSALLDSFTISEKGNLAIRENRLDSLMHFAVSRHAMYRQLYQHRTLMAADMINASIARRLREMDSVPCFADEHMEAVLHATSPLELPLTTLFHMREAWWRYHLLRWLNDDDTILKDLCKRLIARRLLKTVRILPDEDGESLESYKPARLELLPYILRLHFQQSPPQLPLARMGLGDQREEKMELT